MSTCPLCERTVGAFVSGWRTESKGIVKSLTGRVFLALGVLLVAAYAHGDDWADGTAAFQRGDYAKALAYFEAARKSGPTGPAVHYNIAVCQYELKRYPAAGETFLFIARKYPRMAGIAEYNLGLVSQRIGDTASAADHFLRAYRLSADNETIRVLASNQLAEIDVEAPSVSSWSGAYGLRAGYDDNIALRDTAGIPLGVTTESPMADLFASISGPYSGQSGGLRFEGSFYGVSYFDADDFDQNEIAAGAVYEWRPDGWRVLAGVNAGAGWLGGDAFDRRLGLSVEGIRSFGGTATASIAYRYTEIREGDGLFDGIRGQRQHVVARYRRYIADGKRLLARLDHETNDRRDGGVSPARTGLSVDYRYLPDTGWGFEVGASYRRSRFDKAVVPRTENLFSAQAALTRRFAADWIFLVEYRYANNDSSDPVFSYDRNALTLGAMRTF